MSSKRDPLSPPRGVDRTREEQFFLLANLAFGKPSCGREDLVRARFQMDPDYVLLLKGVKGYIERGAGRPFVQLAFQQGYLSSQMGGLYRRYVNWYFRNEVANAKPSTTGETRAVRGGQK